MRFKTALNLFRMPPKAQHELCSEEGAMTVDDLAWLALETLDGSTCSTCGSNLGGMCGTFEVFCDKIGGCHQWIPSKRSV